MKSLDMFYVIFSYHREGLLPEDLSMKMTHLYQKHENVIFGILNMGAIY